MPWNTLQAGDVQAEILPDELAFLNTVEGSTAILPAILGAVIAELQAQILVGGNQIGATGTVPDQIRGDAIAIARWRWFCSMPKTDLQGDSRKAQFEAAQKHMDKIREGREKVEIPAAPQNTAGPSFRVEKVRKGRRVRTDDFNTLGTT